VGPLRQTNRLLSQAWQPFAGRGGASNGKQVAQALMLRAPSALRRFGLPKLLEKLKAAAESAVTRSSKPRSRR
jgi:hypothetical protein